MQHANRSAMVRILHFTVVLMAMLQGMGNASVALGTASLPMQSDPAISYQFLAFSPDQAPGQPMGVTLGGGVSAAALNESGLAAFQSYLVGPDGVSGSRYAEFIGRAGELSPLFVEGDPAPGVPTSTWASPRSSIAQLTDSGAVLLHGSVRGPNVDNSNDEGLWVGEPATLQLLARQGDPLPFGDGRFRDIIQGATMNNSGVVAFSANHSPDADTNIQGGGIWVGTIEGLDSVAMAGDSAPGTDGVFRPNMGSPRLSETGQLLFAASIEGGTVRGFDSTGVWYGDQTELQLLARANSDLTIGLLSVRLATSQSFQRYQLSANGNAAFSAETIITDTMSGNVTGGESLFVGRPGNLRIVAMSGAPAPGAVAGVQFDHVDIIQPLINDRADVAFFAELKGAGVTSETEYGFWMEKDGVLQKVARNGDPAPGLPAGVAFQELDAGALALSEAGQVAFMATLQGGEYDGLNSLWATDHRDRLRLVALEGAPFETPHGSIKVIRRSSPGAGPGIRLVPDVGTDGVVHSAFDTSGRLAFRLLFDDFTTGVIIASIPVPEPYAAGLCVATVAAWSRRRRIY